MQCTYCICGAKMVAGRIQQGVAKCNNLNCQQVLTGRLCYYCPNGGNVQQHTKGFFYCQKCANQLARGAQVVQAKPATVKSNPSYPAQRKSKGPQVVKQGFMEKKGQWINTSYKKRWFKLWSNKKMAYLTHPGASYTKGYCDLTAIKKMERTNKVAFEVTTSERVWAFQCQNEAQCTEWFNTIQRVCTNVPVQQKAPPQQPVQYAQKPPQQRQQRQQPVQYDSGPYRPPQPQPAVQPQYAMQQQPVQYVMAAQQQPQPVNYGNNNNGNAVYPNLAKPSNQMPSAPQQQPQQQPAPQQPQAAAQNLQPGMAGYDVGDMYGGNGANGWEEKAPPPAYAAASAPFAPSAPPMEDEGNTTHQ